MEYGSKENDAHVIGCVRKYLLTGTEEDEYISEKDLTEYKEGKPTGNKQEEGVPHHFLCFFFLFMS